MIENLNAEIPSWLKDFDLMILGLILGFTLGLMMLVVAKRLGIWGEQMGKKRREDEIKMIFADILVDGVTERRLLNETDSGYLSTLEAHEWLRKFGNILSIRDLVPRNEEMMKTYLLAKHMADPAVASTKPVITAPATQPSLVQRLQAVIANGQQNAA